MEIAVLSDIHGNFEAFQACMDYALARNIHTFLFLGDYLGELRIRREQWSIFIIYAIIINAYLSAEIKRIIG